VRALRAAVAAAMAGAMLWCGAVPAAGAEGVAAPPAPVAELVARTIRSYAAPEADQGVAVDRDHFYAIDNRLIVKYRRDTGAAVGRWEGPDSLAIRHLNSCIVRASDLVCAHSNYPLLPMGSSVERFDTGRMTHKESRSLGLRDEGSLVWLFPWHGGWMAGFAHYDRADGQGGVGFKDARYGSVITFDREWRRTGGWLFPASIQERMRPHAASGGALGPDGLLYVLGHDRPEIYVLAMPRMGPVLVHLATIAADAPGQAFAFVPGGRQIMAVDRHHGRVNLIELPPVGLPDPRLAAPFR